MSVTSGFFNSLNHDRRYNAQQMSSIFDGVINDGVFANIGVAFKVTATGGVTVNIGEGKAWFNSAWVYNDTVLPLTFEASEVVLDRIDAIVIDIDHNESVRSGTIKIVKGTPSSSPKRPTMASDKKHKQAPLVYVYRKAGSTEITQADITNMVGTSECPYITGILQVQNIDNIVAQWNAQWNQWYAEKTAETNSDASELLAEMKSEFDIWFAYIQLLLSEKIVEADSNTSELLAKMKSEFEIWFADVQALLDDDVATALAGKVAELQGKFDTLALEGCVYDTIEDSDLDVILGSDGTPIEGKTMLSGGGGSTNALQRSGGEMRGPIDMKGNPLAGLDDPLLPDEAASKNYVDTGLAEMNDRVVYSGGKNLIRLSATRADNGLYVINPDGTITIDGTNVGATARPIGNVKLEPGDYMISGVPYGVGGVQLWTYINGSQDTSLNVSDGTEKLLRLTETSVITLRLYFGNNVTFSNIIVRPMIRRASVGDATFEPYYEGLVELSNNRRLLWENSSPTSEFPAQNINIDISQFTDVEVLFFGHKNNQQMVSTGRVPIDGRRAQMISVMRYSGTNLELGSRTFVPSASGVDFEDAYYNSLDANIGWNLTVNQCIPYRIYAYKGVTT